MINNLVKVKMAAKLSQEAYLDDHEVYFSDEHTGTYGFLQIVDGDLYVVYRGTDNIKDLLIDLQTTKKNIPYNNYKTDILIHSGFLESYESVRTEVTQKIFHDYESYNNIYFCGHSLGTVCILNLLDIIYNFHDKKCLQNKKIYCYTFGAPAVGNMAFANSTNKRMIKFDVDFRRFVFADDIVPKYPMLCGYKQTEVLVEIGKKSWWKIIGSVEDHRIKNYVDCLNSME